MPEGEKVGPSLPSVNVGLLGLWHGAWKAPPGELDFGDEVKVDCSCGNGNSYTYSEDYRGIENA